MALEQVQEQELTKRLELLGYPEIQIKRGQEDVLMLFIGDHLICSVDHALSLSDEDLKALIY